MSYCKAINNMKGDELNVHKIYHDTQYGFPIEDDNELFCRLILEINQAGLSWTTILKSRKLSARPIIILILKKWQLTRIRMYNVC